MPIDQTEPAPTATGTSRRAFLTRGAAGGALAATVAATGLAGFGGLGALAPAGAQDGGDGVSDGGGSGGSVDNDTFARSTAPLELAAAVAYGAALSGDTLGGQWSQDLRMFQSHHQEVAEALLELVVLEDGESLPVADAAVTAQFTPPPGADEAAILTLFAGLEEALAATHLSAIGVLEENSLAKIVAQACAVEQQQAVVLGRASGTPIAELTPATASVDGGLSAGAPVPEGGGESDDGSAGADGDGDSTGSDNDGEDTGSGSGSGGTNGSGGGSDSGVGEDATDDGGSSASGGTGSGNAGTSDQTTQDSGN